MEGADVAESSTTGGECREASGQDGGKVTCQSVDDQTMCGLIARCFWGCNPSPWSNSCVDHCMKSHVTCADLTIRDRCEVYLDCRWEVGTHASNQHNPEPVVSAVPQNADIITQDSAISMNEGYSSDVALIVLAVLLAFGLAFVIDRIGNRSGSRFSPSRTVDSSLEGKKHDGIEVRLEAREETQSPTPNIVHKYTHADELLTLIPEFVALSTGTEFGHYQEAQWSFLLSGNEISTFVIKTSDNGNNSSLKLCGCVLSVVLDPWPTIGLGMVLVDPIFRRKGIARKLIKAAWNAHTSGTENNKTTANNPRFILAVCSEVGHPLYRSIGFKDVGMVHAMSCPVKVLKRYATHSAGNSFRCIGEDDVHKARGIVYKLDKRATGYDRKERIDLLLDAEYAPDAVAQVVFGYDYSTHGDDNRRIRPCSFAIFRQDCLGGPLIVGPVVGPPSSALPMLCYISLQHDDDNSSLSMLVSNHKEDVVDMLMEIDGFDVAWTGPSMSSDAKPIYRDEALYLALMHPTLG